MTARSGPGPSGWSGLATGSATDPMVRVGAAVHSLRALTPGEVTEVAAAAHANDWVLHST